MRTVILEGPDGAGKSTLAERLVGLGYHRENFSVPPKEAQKNEETIFQFFFKPLYELSQKHPWLVLDRLHLSDRVYGPVMRGGSPMTERAERLLERYIEAIDGQIVLCLPPKRVAFTNWLSRKGQEYVQRKHDFDKIYEGYAKLLLRNNRRYLWYDYTRHHALSIARAIQKMEGYPLPARMVGSQRPRFLFVGEKPNGPPDLPFMTTRGSSGWLFDAIVEAGFKEDEIAFVNARTVNGLDMNLESIIYKLGGQRVETPAVIALGNVACQALGGIKHSEISHPQYAKRFEARDRGLYVRKLSEIRRKHK